jgi:hypothetical protein
MSKTVDLNIPHSARLRYVAQLEAHMDEDGKTGPNNVHDLIQIVRDAEARIAALEAERDEAAAKAEGIRLAIIKRARSEARAQAFAECEEIARSLRPLGNEATIEERGGWGGATFAIADAMRRAALSAHPDAS